MLAIISLLLYTASKYNKDPFKEIIVDHVDTFEVIEENIPRPKNLKKLVSTQFIDSLINEPDYPYPYHAGTPNAEVKAKIINEGKKIRDFYNKRCDFTQDELCYHPTAYQQERTTFENMANVTAIKVRVTLNPYVGDIRVSNMYLPAGELITVEYLSEKAIGTVKLTVNAQKYPSDDSYKNRYPHQQATVTLKNKINTWGYPFGGPVTFQYNGAVPIELIVTGCFKAPLFQYGVTDEVKFKEEIMASVVPKSMMDIGCIISIFSTNVAKTQVTRINDVAQFYRSAKTRSQLAVKDDFNPRYDRPTKPNKFFYDPFVLCGGACTYVQLNMNQYQESAIPNMVNYDNIVTGKVAEAYIVLHEMNHLHQTNFGYEETLEVSNNMLTLMIYASQTSIAGNKQMIDGKMYGAGFQEAYTTLCFMFKLLDGYYFSWDQTQWAIMIQSFGPKKFTEYAKCCSENTKYPASNFSKVGRHILCASDVFKHGMLEVCEESPVIKNNWGDKKGAFLEEYNKLPYKDIKFHPFCNFYAVGFERDGERFTTQMPTLVEPYSKTTYNFNTALKYFVTSGNQFGKFQFYALNGTEGRWKEKSKGVYEYSAGGNISEIDEYTVDYKDLTNGIITRTFGQMKLSRSWHMNFTGYTYYLNGSDLFTCISVSPVVRYRLAVQQAPNETSRVSTFITFNSDDHLSVVHATFIPTYDVPNAMFAARCEQGAAVYMSDKPLKGNPEDDKNYLIIKNDKYVQVAWNGQQSKPISLVKGKKYYLIIVYNFCGKNTYGVDIVYKKQEEKFTQYRNLDSDWFRIPGTTDEMIREASWKPEFIEIQGLEKWRGSNFIPVDNSNWNVVKRPGGRLYSSTRNSQGVECKKNCNISNFLFGGDYESEYRANWWKDIGFTAFPHDFIIDFGKPTRFSVIKLTGAGHQGYFPMNSSIEIHLADNQDNVIKNETLIFSGRYISNIKDNLIKLGRSVEGSFMFIRVHDNTFKWKDNNAGRTDFSGIDVGDTMIYANKMSMLKGCNWEVKQGVGYGLNGMQYIGKKGDSYEVKVKRKDDQFCFIGAKFDSMGSATVYQDGKKVATISKDSINSVDRNALNFASKSYMQILYASENITKTTTFKIVVDSGKIILNGYLVGENHDVGNDEEEDEEIEVPVTQRPNKQTQNINNPNEDNIGNGNKKSKSKVGSGTIAGIVIGVIAAIIIVAAIAIFIKIKKVRNADSESIGEMTI